MFYSGIKGFPSLAGFRAVIPQWGWVSPCPKLRRTENGTAPAFIVLPLDDEHPHRNAAFGGIRTRVLGISDQKKEFIAVRVLKVSARTPDFRAGGGVDAGLTFVKTTSSKMGIQFSMNKKIRRDLFGLWLSEAFFPQNHAVYYITLFLESQQNFFRGWLFYPNRPFARSVSI